MDWCLIFRYSGINMFYKIVTTPSVTENAVKSTWRYPFDIISGCVQTFWHSLGWQLLHIQLLINKPNTYISSVLVLTILLYKIYHLIKTRSSPWSTFSGVETVESLRDCATFWSQNLYFYIASSKMNITGTCLSMFKFCPHLFPLEFLLKKHKILDSLEFNTS